MACHNGTKLGKFLLYVLETYFFHKKDSEDERRNVQKTTGQAGQKVRILGQECGSTK
jgi:hypothetical protein